MSDNSFGEALKCFRKSAKMSLKDVADASGVSASHLSQIERGRRAPRRETIDKLEKGLSLKEGDLGIKAGYIPEEVLASTRAGDSSFIERTIVQTSLQGLLNKIGTLVQTSSFQRCISDVEQLLGQMQYLSPEERQSVVNASYNLNVLKSIAEIEEK